jgi:two-component system cell cycle response regulator DivK
MKVFVCEDEKEIAEIIKTILENQNHEVKLDFGGNKILESIMSFTPNLIILDYRLPNLDGEKLTKKLKADEKTKKIPVVIISASNYLEKVAIDSKADDYLSKPFNIENLLAIVTKYDSQ